jgi:hypothetical protein
MAAVTLAVYVNTMFPSAAGGDATELAFIACDAAAGPATPPPGYTSSAGTLQHVVDDAASIGAGRAAVRPLLRSHAASTCAHSSNRLNTCDLNEW